MLAYLGFLAAIAVRTAIVLILITIALRLLGKRKIGELHIYDLLLILIISNALQNSMTESNGAIWVAFVSSGTILLLGWIAAKFFVHHPLLELRLMGAPAVIVDHGRLMRATLQHEHLEEHEVMMAVRQQGLDTLADVRLAILEPDGTISVVPVESARTEG